MAPSLATQILSPMVLLGGTFLFGILPITVRKHLLNCGCEGCVCKSSCRARKGKVITSFLIYLGGGVLLATCLVHLLPEAREGFEHYYEHAKDEQTKQDEAKNVSLEKEDEEEEGGHHHEEFSMPEFVVCCGFFAVYLVEEIIHFFLGNGGHSHAPPIPTETRAIRSFSRSNSCHSAPRSTYSGSFQNSTEARPPTLAPCEKLNDEATVENGSCLSNLGFSVTSLLTVAALSFHSLFEGFAIGLQSTDSGLWILFAAVSVHKLVIAFVVGLEVLAGGGKNQLLYVYMSIFASMSPFGMIIAMITQSEVEDSAPLTVGVLNAIATGTLLYVTFCEILQREEEHQNLKGWQQFLATLLGFSIMCVVQLISTLV